MGGCKYCVASAAVVIAASSTVAVVIEINSEHALHSLLLRACDAAICHAN